MTLRRWLLVVVMVPLPLQAQRGPPLLGDPGLSEYTFDFVSGEPISTVLELSRFLQISEVQRKRLMDVRRRVRVQNAPFMARLDTLRSLAGVNLSDENGLGRRDVEAMRRYSQWAQPTIDSIRANNEVAGAEGRELLSSDQRHRLDSILSVDRRRGTRRRPRERLVERESERN